MGDPRAGSTGTTATTVATPDTTGTAVPGKRVARHSAERRMSQPYVGRRIARVAPVPVEPQPVEPVRDLESLPYAGRRVAGRNPVGPPAPAPVGSLRSAGRRIAVDADLTALAGDDEVVGHLLRPTATPTLGAYAGRRIARPVETVTEARPVEAPARPATSPAPLPAVRHAAPKQTRPGGRRAARRTRIPSLPLLAGVAVLAISAGGALQAAHPDLAGADGRISPANALSGSSAVGSASVLGGRSAAVSRDADRQALSGHGASLRAAADRQAKERDAALSALAGKAEKQAAQIKLHQWVLPVAPGVYHLTARFGDYSALWSHFHTGLDFAAPTGTPIMAVAEGTITDVGYSGAYGNRTIERLPDGTELWYCHQNEFGTEVGATVKPGQVIGYVGSTGNVTGPHLHLEVHPGGGDPVDPYTALQVHGLHP